MESIYNFHPPLAAFPFALIFVVVLLEVLQLLRGSLQFEQVIRVNLVIASIFAVLAFFSGYQANDLANQSFVVTDSQISQHHLFGKALLFSLIPCLALRFLAPSAKHGAKVFWGIYYLLLTICFGLVMYTGYLGAELVFGHGAAVRAVVK